MLWVNHHVIMKQYTYSIIIRIRIRMCVYYCTFAHAHASQMDQVPCELPHTLLSLNRIYCQPPTSKRKSLLWDGLMYEADFHFNIYITFNFKYQVLLWETSMGKEPMWKIRNTLSKGIKGLFSFFFFGYLCGLQL